MRSPGQRIVAFVPGGICARWAGHLEDIVRRHYRPLGGMPQDLEAVFTELRNAGADYEAIIAATTSATTSDDCTPDFRDGKVETMTTDQAAQRLGCTERNIRDLCKRGRLDARRAPTGRAWQIDAASVTDYLKDRDATDD